MPGKGASRNGTQNRSVPRPIARAWNSIPAPEKLKFKTIAEYLDMLLSEKKLQKNEVIARSNLDRNYAYQIFNGRKTNPSRDKMIMLSIGMGLTLEETRKLLKVSSLSDLYIRNPRDSIIMYCLVQKNDLIETNETLSNYGVDILE